MSGKPGEDNHQASVSVGHELSDAEARPLVYAGLILAAILVLIGLGMAGTFYFFGKEQKLGPAATPFEDVRTLPPLPRLQVDPKMELKEYRDSQREVLNSYGWVDRTGGVVRIPIDRAIDLTIVRGVFPARPNSAAPVNERASGSGVIPGPVDTGDDAAPGGASPKP